MDIHPSSKPILTHDQRLRVFVSSTIEELGPERETVIEAILELKLHPVFFESGARPYPPRQVYSSGIEQSQIFIGIYWESYGWVAPEMEISGIEDEFNLSKNKPQLIYFKKPAHNQEERLVALLGRIQSQGNISFKKFDDVAGLGEQVKNDLMLLLSESFGIEDRFSGEAFLGPSYIDLLNEEIKKKNSIYREKPIADLKNLLSDHPNILITGEPGIGKTFILGQLGLDTGAIYISLKNKTAQQVYANVAIHLAIKRNVLPQPYPTESESKAAFQIELANSSTLLIYDDVDQNIELYSSLQGLEFYETNAIFAARSEKNLIHEGTQIYSVPAFSREEVLKYLEKIQMNLSPGEFQRLLSASNRNPLYLYYFSNYQVSPFPQGLNNYQNALWGNLTSVEKEIMNLIALSSKGLEIADIHALLNREIIVSETIMGTTDHIETLQPLIRSIDSKYQVFHFYFEEFIHENSTTLGLSEQYHAALAEHAILRNWIIPTAIHLIGAKDARARDYSTEAIEASLLSGSWNISEQLLEYELSELEKPSTNDDKSKHAEAKTRFFLAQVFLEMGRYEESKTEMSRSMDIFTSLGDSDWLNQVKYWSSLLLIHDGEIERAIENFKEGVKRYSGVDKYGEAISELHLSYSYIQISKFDEGVLAAKRALDLFSELKDGRGISLATVNLSACVGGLGDRAQQEIYAEEIIKIAEETNNPRLKAAGLNHLAIVLRKKGDPDGAEAALEEAIHIAQKMKSYDLEVLNIGNLGNVYLDRDEFEKAEKAYTESLSLSREHGLAYHEARDLELLARLKFMKKEYEISKELGKDALSIHKKYKDPIRLGSTYDYLGRANEKLDLHEEAAESYEMSGYYYQIAKEWKDAAYAYRQALGEWDKLGNVDKVEHCLKEGINCSILASSPTIAQDMLTDVSDISQIENSEELLKVVFEEHLKADTNEHFPIFIQNFYLFCTRNPSKENIDLYRRSILKLAAYIEDTSQRILINTLAIGIAQSNSIFFPNSELDKLSEVLAEKLDGLYFRGFTDNNKIWTIGTAWENGLVAQISTVSQDQEVMRVSLALSLITYANSDFLQEDAKSNGNIVDDRFSMSVITQKDFEEVASISIEESSGKENREIQASLSSLRDFSDDEANPLFLILHHNYEEESDGREHPGNKALVWVLMLYHSGFVSNSLHEQRENLPHLARKSREFCEKVLI